MTDVELHQEVSVPLMDDTAGGLSLEIPDMDAGPSAETPSSSGELADEQVGAEVSVVYNLGHLLLRVLTLFSIITNYHNNDSVPRVAGNFENEIVQFMAGIREFYENILGTELQEYTANTFRQVFSDWNTFLQHVEGARDTSVSISSDIHEDINKFIPWLEEHRGEQWTEDNTKWMKIWLPRWNMFLQARAGQTLVTRWNVFLTIVGFIFYIVDLVSDVGTSIYYTVNGQWWRAMGTLAIVYGAVIFYTVIKWINNQIHCTGAADWIRYVIKSLVNWPDLDQYGALCRVEWRLHKSPACSAHLVPEWHQRRVNVAYLKYTEGVWEACPQAILQLCLLVPDLYGHWTWTDYLRIAGACVSLCTAGAALVNYEKYRTIMNYTDLPLSELVVLHVWAVPVTVSRLLSVTLLLSVHLYWALAGVALHLVLYGIRWRRTERVPRSLTDVIRISLYTLQFFMSPFDVGGSVTARCVTHAVHLLVNTAMMVVWALGTPLVCAHPALYTATICFNAGNMCYVCLKAKDKSLIDINSSSSVNRDIIHIIGDLPFNLGWLKTKRIILICDECCRRLRETYQLLAMCLENSAVLQGYMEKLNTASVTDTDNEAELRVDLKNKQDNISEIKCEIKLEEEEIYTVGPIIEETEDVFMNVDDCFVKEEDSWKMEEVGDEEESPMENNPTESSDNESDENSNTHDTDADSDGSESTSTQVHTTNKKKLNTPAKKSHKCLTCSKSFSYKSKLQMHTRVHTGEKPYKCATCEMCFAQKCHLVRHMRTHTGEKPYKCATCARCFARKFHLMRHMRAHTGEKPVA